MKGRADLVLAALLVVLGVAVNELHAQTTVSQAYRLVWDIDAPNVGDAQGYEYRVVAEGVPDPIILSDIRCAPAAGAFECSAAFPAFVPGVEHAIRVTANNDAGPSLPSNEIRFEFRLVPAQPRNLRPVRP